MKYLVAILLILHGLIHLLGFLKGYGIARLPSLQMEISRTAAVFWLLAGMGFLTAGILYLIYQPSWAALTLSSIVISEILIIIAWQDAKAGTLPNIMLLLVAVIALAHQTFKNESERLVKELTALPSAESRNRSAEMNVPPLISKWMTRSGVQGKTISTVHLTQKGRMRTEAGGKWMEFEAEQFVNPYRPGFIWTTNVKMMPGIFLSGRDRLDGNTGSMKIFLLSLFPVVNEADNPKINSGTLIRFISECCWYPHMATDPRLKWTTLNADSVGLEYTLNGITVKGSCTFTPEGDYSSFSAKRYYSGGDNAREETWVIEVKDWKTFQGVRVPSLCEVSWDLDTGRFHWLTLEVTSLKYDPVR